MASEGPKEPPPPSGGKPGPSGSPGAEASDRRLAERRGGMERRQPHQNYDRLTQHPRPERNINDYPLNTDEIEFINALEDYKRKFDRPFPTWSEVLHILRTLGYDRSDIFGEGMPPGVPGPPMPPGGRTPPKPRAEGDPAPPAPAPRKPPAGGKS